MPLLEVTLVEGRSRQTLRKLAQDLHDTVVRSIGASPESVRIVLREVPDTHWMSGGVTIAERRSAANGQEGASGS